MRRLVSRITAVALSVTAVMSVSMGPAGAADNTATSSEGVDVRIVVALIGALIAAIGALVGIAIKFVLDRYGARQDRTRTARAVQEKYSDPVARAAESLMWRIKELVEHDGRAHFLQAKENHTEYEKYKASSTVYRLMALVAWNRALERELFFLRSNTRGKARKMQLRLDAALAGLAAALADGGNREIERMNAIAAQFEVAVPPERREEIAAKLDILLRRTLSTKKATGANLLSDQDQRILIGESLALLGVGPEAITRERQRNCIAALSGREAWIYRDWQSAIGDILIKDSTGGDERRFTVVGYRDFEEMCDSGTADQKKWIRRSQELFVDLNISTTSSDPVAISEDARANVIRDVYRACGEILCAVHSLQGRASAIRDKTVKHAIKISTL